MNTNPSSNKASTDSQADMLRTDPEQRRKVQRLIVAMAVAALLLFWLGLPALNRWISVNDVTVMTRRMALVWYGLGALLIGTAAYSGWYARRIFVSSQFPPPGTWVMKDTPVLRGEQARARGWWVLTCAISFVLLGTYTAAFLPGQMDGLLNTPHPGHAAPIAAPHG